MANKFSHGQVVTISDGLAVRDVWTAPPSSESFRADVGDGTRGTVVSVWAGGEIYTVAFPLQRNGGVLQGFAAFAESELS
jgi:hypothetical protein